MKALIETAGRTVFIYPGFAAITVLAVVASYSFTINQGSIVAASSLGFSSSAGQERVCKDKSITENSADVVTRDDSGWRLKLVVVVSGAVLMGLELTGIRVIAAHFGSSIFVWGAIIGVFLSSLAAGYYLGGSLADRRPNFFLLNLLLLIAGAWLLTIPIYADLLCRGIRQVNPGVRSGPLAGCRTGSDSDRMQAFRVCLRFTGEISIAS